MADQPQGPDRSRHRASDMNGHGTIKGGSTKTAGLFGIFSYFSGSSQTTSIERRSLDTFVRIAEGCHPALHSDRGKPRAATTPPASLE